jgi:hypothetical protein
LIKGLSDRLEIPWSLSREWAPTARRVLEGNANMISSTIPTGGGDGRSSNVRIRDVLRLLKGWARGKATRAILRLPSPVRTKVAGVALRFQKRREAREEKKR